MTNENIYDKAIVPIEKLRGLERKVSKLHFDKINSKLIPYETRLYKNCQDVWEIYTIKKNNEPELIFRQPNLDFPGLGLSLSMISEDEDELSSILGSKGIIRLYDFEYIDRDPNPYLFIRDTPYIQNRKKEELISQKKKEKKLTFKPEEVRSKQAKDLGLKKEESEILRIILGTIEDKGKIIETEKPIDWK